MVHLELDPASSIPVFYAGRSILITGASGFMGKVLIEKLLRSCPEIQEIFLLMRPKKGMNIDDRLRKLLSLPLFDKLREEQPSSFQKLIPVTGDVAEEGLGLPAIERRVLTEKVSIIFHVAASVKFDDPLKYAVLMNTRGTRDVCILAESMKKLVALVHVSTTYSNTDRPVIEEQIYPPQADWKKTIKIAETQDDHTLNVLTAKYLGSMPNTYTFTKQLAEHVVNDYAGTLPIVLLRPSVVISTIDEPVKGWLDNFNGPVGMMIGGGKGILRTTYLNPDVTADFIPVDVAIKAMILTAWKRGLETVTRNPSIFIYNCSSCGLKTVTNKDLIEMALRCTEQIPLDDILWVPSTTIHTVKSIHFIYVLFLHLLPALIIDGILKISGRKPMLVRLHRKIYTATIALEYFITNAWRFSNTNLLNLLHQVPPADKDAFYVDYGTYDIYEYFKNSLIGSKIYLLKEDMNKLADAKAHYNMMWWIDRALKTWFVVFVAWFAVNSGLPSYLSDTVMSVYDTPRAI